MGVKAPPFFKFSKYQIMNKISLTQQFFIWAGGFDKKTIENATSSEVSKMALLGSMVIVPALIGFFSFGYGIYLISGDETYALIGGMVWSVVIFIIDRAIMGYGKPGEFNLGLLGRFLLAVTVGLVIAEPIILLAFNDAIQEQQYEEMQVKVDAVNTKYDDKVEGVGSEITTLQQRVDAKQQSYTTEMDGTGGSGYRNQGPIYEKKYADYQAELTSFNEEKIRLERLIKSAESGRTSELALLTESMGNGLLTQINALNRIDSPAVSFATWVLRLFFFFIELIPFFMKISPSGRGLYYEIIDRNDDEALEIQEATAEERKAVLIKSESIRRTKEILELFKIETKAVLNSKKEQTVFLMEQLNTMTDKKLAFQFKIIKNVTDEGAREKLLTELDEIFNGFVGTVETILEKSNNFHTKTAKL